MSEFESALLEGAGAVGLEVSDVVASGLERHYELLNKWAKKMNLTAVKDPVRAAHLHGLDSLLFAELLDPEETAATVDVGSGAGFPGIPLALARPRLSIVLLEPIRKRASFLRVALAELGLSQVRVVEGRLEEAEGPRGLWPAELIVSRATIAPAELARLATPKLVTGGRLITTSGAGAAPKEALEESGLRHLRRLERRLPGGEQRILDLLVRESPADD